MKTPQAQGRANKYFVTTWDMDLQRFTPQIGVKPGPYSQFGLRKALRELRCRGYDTTKLNGYSVLVEKR